MILLAASLSGVARPVPARISLPRARVTATCAGIPTAGPAPSSTRKVSAERNPRQGTFSLEPFLHWNGKTYTCGGCQTPPCGWKRTGLPSPRRNGSCPVHARDKPRLPASRPDAGVVRTVIASAQTPAGVRCAPALRGRCARIKLTPPCQAWPRLERPECNQGNHLDHGRCAGETEPMRRAADARPRLAPPPFEQGVISDHLVQPAGPGKTSVRDDLGFAFRSRCVLT